MGGPHRVEDPVEIDIGMTTMSSTVLVALVVLVAIAVHFGGSDETWLSSSFFFSDSITKNLGPWRPPGQNHHWTDDEKILAAVLTWVLGMSFILCIMTTLLLVMLWSCLMIVPIGLPRKVWGDEIVTTSEVVGPAQGSPYRRRLGLLERWYVATSRCRQHTGFGMVLELEENNHRVDPDDWTAPCVQEALQRVTRRFSFLRTRVQRSGVTGVDSTTELIPVSPTEEAGISSKSPSWIWGDDLYLQVLLKNSSAADSIRVPLRTVELVTEDNNNNETWGEAHGLRPILQQEAGTPWHDEDPAAPMMRAVLVVRKRRHPSSHSQPPSAAALILSFHHLITDGLGATTVIRAFLEELQRASGHITSPPSSAMSEDGGPHRTPAEILPPPMEDVIDTVPQLKHGWRLFLMDRWPIFRWWLDRPYWPGPHPLSIHDETLSAVRSSEMVCVPLLSDPAQVQHLRSWCRTNGITVNDFSLAALGQALALVIQQQHALFPSSATAPWTNNKTLTFKVVMAVNERSRTQVDAAQLGCYLSAAQIWLKVPSLSSCSSRQQRQLQKDEPRTGLRQVVRLARRVKQSSSKARRESTKEMGLMSLIRQDWLEFCRDRAKQQTVPETIEWSNLGMVDLDTTSSTTAAVVPTPEWTLKNWWFAQGRREMGAALTVALISTPVGGLNAVMSAFPDVVPREALIQIGQEWQSMIMEAASLTR